MALRSAHPMPLICSIDQTENPDGSLFCSRCNAKLTRLRSGERSPDPRFVVGSRLREDPFSLAFLAENPDSGKRYVLREFYRANAGNRDLMRRFAEIAQSLESSIIVSMRTVSACTNAGRWYTVVESTEGTTLRSELDKSPMNAETTAKWFRAILAALRELHEASLYHGNLSSNVVMLRDDGRVDLVDSVFMGESLREGGPAALSSMVRKDIRDSGLLALEMLDGQVETGETGKIGERLARVPDVPIGATLDYVFSTDDKTPDSAAEVSRLIEVIKEAESAGDGKAVLLYRQAYGQSGSRRLKEVLDNIQEPPAPLPPRPPPPPPLPTEVKPKPVDVKPPPSPLPTNGSRPGHGKVLAAIGAAALCVLALWLFMSRRNTPWNPSLAFSAGPQTIARKQQSTLQWSVGGASAAQLNGEDVPVNGTRVVSPAETTTYRLVAIGPRGASQRREITIQVTSAPPPSIRFSGDRDAISPGEGVRLRWSAVGATRVRIDPGLDSLPASGEHAVSPQQTTEYVLTAEGDGGAATSRVQVRVNPVPAPAIESFEAIPAASSSSGAAVLLRWRASGGAHLSLEPAVGPIDAGSTFVTVHPTKTTDYMLTAENALGARVSRSLTLTVSVAPPPTIEFSGSRSRIELGQSLWLRWTVINATHITLEPGGDVSSNPGQQIVYPPATTDYRLTAVGPGGTSTNTFPVHVAPAIATFEAAPVPDSGERCRTWVLRWTIHGASYASIEPEIGGVNPSSGYRAVRPLQTIRYVLTANSPGGSTTREATIGGCTAR